MKANTNQGWSTLQEGTEHYLYRSVSSMSFARLEALVQRLQDCQNQAIAIPEIVRMPNGEVYLKEPRGIRTVEDFLSTGPSTRAKLFVVQQLFKLLENLHTFVGTAHGNLHLGCLSIGLDEKLILGGIAPVEVEFADDIEALKPLLSKIFTQPIEAGILRSLSVNSLKKMRRELKTLLTEDAWDDIQSDWTNAVQQTNIEESSEELPVDTNGIQQNADDDDPFNFDDLDQTLDLGNPLDDLDGMPEPENMRHQTEEQTLDALFEDFDNLDDLDDFGSLDEDLDFDLKREPAPKAVQSTLEKPPEIESNPEEWSDVDLDSWLDDVPEPAGLQDASSVEVNQSPVSNIETSDDSSLLTKSTDEALTPNNFVGDLADDWFTSEEKRAPVVEHSAISLEANESLEANQQTAADLEEISDFDVEDDDETLVFTRPTADKSTPSKELDIPASDALEQSTPLEVEASIHEKSDAEPAVSETDELDWFDNTETADFMLSDFEVDALTAEAREQSIEDINEFSLDDDLDINDIAPNESDIKETTHIEVEVNNSRSPSQPKGDIFNQGSLFSSETEQTEPDMTEQSIQPTAEPSESKIDDWFADDVSEPESRREVSNSNPQIHTDETEASIPKWVMVAGAAVVAGGAWSATQTRQVDTPSVHIDESEIQVNNEADRFIPTEKTAVTAKVQQETSTAEDVLPTDTPIETEANVPVSEKVATTKPVPLPKKAPVKKTAKAKKVTKKKAPTKSASPFVKVEKTQTAEKQSAKTNVATLPTPPKSVKPKVNKVPQKSEAVSAKTEVTVKTPVQMDAASTDAPSSDEKNSPSSDAIAASLSELVKGTVNETENTATKTENEVIPETEAQTVVEEIAPSAQQENNEDAAPQETEVSEPVVEAQTNQPESEENEAVEIDDTLSDSVVSETNENERVTEETVETEVPVPKISTTSLTTWSKDSIKGTLSKPIIKTLLEVPTADRMFTRANAIVLTHAQQSNDSTLIEESLNNLLSIDSNAHKPIYLLAMAQYQFNQQDLDKTREYLMQAEMNWANVERSQLSVLRAQRDNIVAHLSYIDFLENGSEDSRLQSLTQFRKVQREARRARLQSLFEQAEAKMQKLQRQKR